ncbi:MAG: DNA polymerase III subunit gamma/tau [Clostridiales bacterium]|nr:DNA polymerase III subunit gamma/tau [Clostridiales bacterium]
MAYTALYRRFRPRRFGEVVGQEHIVDILKNQVRERRASHAYLFCGTRGTGKTSTAQILARAIRCEAPQGGEPCGACKVCRAGDANGTMDIIEIDAASNNRVDEVRDLREKVRLSPVTGRYKVYIVDEVHMLSAGAFNALLKTLEEPPAHVVFILATTEAHKLPATIVSRCQRFDFKRVSVRCTAERLEHVLGELGVSAERDALVTLARMAQGSVRDALGLLDQCLAAGEGALTRAGVLDVLGAADDMQLKRLADAVISRDPAAALKALQETLDAGRDLNVLLRDLMEHFRRLMLLLVCGDSLDLPELASEMQDVMRRQAKEAGMPFILRALDILAGLEGDMRASVSARVLAEAALVRLSADSLDDTPAALLARIEALEKRAAGKDAPQEEKADEHPARGGGAAAPDTAASGTNAEKERPKPADRVAAKPASQAPDGLFKRLLAALRTGNMPVYIMLKKGTPLSLSGGVLTVRFSEEDAFFTEALEQQETRAQVEEALCAAAGRDVVLKTVVGDMEPVKAPQPAGDEDGNLINEAAALFGEENVRVME